LYPRKMSQRDGDASEEPLAAGVDWAAAAIGTAAIHSRARTRPKFFELLRNMRFSSAVKAKEQVGSFAASSIGLARVCGSAQWRSTKNTDPTAHSTVP